ncbi:hypothetical protein [Subdoligranulum variabile]|uniref:hypothetical protein n=1 Tax=Subdoligranulum variabile TaxID=214851 RepID=UPI0026F3170C|nr:hypothetical protein [Subdoligranulum variabile]
MKIYDEITREEITEPDLSAGYVYDGVIVTGHTEERIEVMEGTVTEDRPEGLRRLIPAQDITEPCQWYHKYTEEELEQQKPSGDMEKRLAALEEELAAAKILLGVE